MYTVESQETINAREAQRQREKRINSYLKRRELLTTFDALVSSHQVLNALLPDIPHKHSERVVETIGKLRVEIMRLNEAGEKEPRNG